MGVRELALKQVLKNKLQAEEIADKNLDKVLKNEDVKLLFLECKKLIVEIAKIEVNGGVAKDKRDEYNHNRELIANLLKIKGIDKRDLRPKYNCTKCKDTGIVGNSPCECLKKEMSKQLIKLSGVDISNMSKFDDDFSMFNSPDEVKCIYNKMKKFILDISTTPIDTVLIMGGTGVGKTHLMECMTTFALEKNIMLKYGSSFNFNQDMLRYHCSKLEDKEDIIEPYLQSDLLFIDDLGTENKINNVTVEYLYLVLNERMNNHKKTVISTNLDFKKIQDTYGERIFSRLMHKKQSLKIKFPGTDLRIKSSK